MVNVENIQKVISYIEKEENYFRMADWSNYNKNTKYPENICGTPSCIGGWAEAIMKFEDNKDFISDQELEDWFGISHEEVHELFYGGLGMRATRQEAVKHLYYIIEGNSPDWSIFVKEED